MDTGSKRIFSYSYEEKLLPQEEMLEKRKSKDKLIIGLPKENTYQEKRIALTPASVELLAENGHEIILEKGAGKAANFTDTEYSESGAYIVNTKKEVYQADIILKIAPPVYSDIEIFKERQTIISALHLTAQHVDYFKQMLSKKVTAISFEHLKDENNIFPIRMSISEIAGNTGILIASEYLSDSKIGKGKMLGGFPGIPPVEVVIIGAGNVGEAASRAAIAQGANVKIFDNSISKLRRIQRLLNTKVYTSIFQKKNLENAIKNADVVIGALHTQNTRSPVIVTEEMIQKMEKGSVVIDISIDQGGCIETSRITTHAEPIFLRDEVIHYAVPNIASRVPNTASHALSNYFAPMMLNIAEEGGIENILQRNKGLRNGTYIYNGVITNKYISDYFNLPYKDIDLLMAAFHG
ncbi:MAG: alanine dehydrogenase [Bacteroidales bacterium]|nr:alanine dehydrogenase [Bacteroidales bacterium]MCF8327533.1 alanine dehydrogenase [Bacteroidales bacterium]